MIIVLVVYDEIVENISYDICCIFCNDVKCGSIFSYSVGVQQLFLNDQMFVDMGVEVYVGVFL